MTKDRDGRNELINAISDKNIEGSINLIKSGKFDLNEADNNGFTALHAAANMLLTPVVKELVKLGADVNSKDSWGNPPILRALGNQAENADIISLLIEAGADIHIKNNSGISVAMHVSKLTGHPNYEQLQNYL